MIMQNSIIIRRWVAQQYDMIGIARDGRVYPVMSTDVPRGAIDEYVWITSPEAHAEIEKSRNQGWKYA
jgi:hypothetical protein